MWQKCHPVAALPLSQVSHAPNASHHGSMVRTFAEEPMAVNQKDVPVFVLCGGLGTRFREQTEFRPKPMVEMAKQKQSYCQILWMA